MIDSAVRTATLSDLQAIVKLSHALFQEDAGQYDPSMNLDWALEEGFEHFRRHVTDNNSLVVVMELDDSIVGYLVGYVVDATRLRPARTAELESMYVLREHRSQGVGGKLFRGFLTWCDEQQAQRVSVTAFARNQRAIRFYERMGLAPKNVSLERPA